MLVMKLFCVCNSGNLLPEMMMIINKNSDLFALNKIYIAVIT